MPTLKRILLYCLIALLTVCMVASCGASKPNTPITIAKTGSPLFDRGQLAQQLGRLDKAISLYSQLIAIDPLHHQAYGKRALAYKEKKQYQQALDDLEEAVRLMPYEVSYVIHRADIYTLMNQPERAIADLTYLINRRYRHWSVYYRRANLYANAQRYADAIPDYTTAATLSPKDPSIYYTRGNAYANAGNVPKAIADYQQALALKPDFTEAQQQLAFWQQKRQPSP